jgi:hypothetical protein
MKEALRVSVAYNMKEALRVSVAYNMKEALRVSVAKFIVHDWGDKVDFDIGLSYWPARLHGLAGQYDNPYAGVNYIPQSRTMNLATGFSTLSYLIPDRFLDEL